MKNEFLIRKLRADDYLVIDACMQELHRLHVDGRPDIFAPLEHLYSEHDFSNIVEDETYIALAAVDENDDIMGFCIAKLRDKSEMVDDLRTVYIDDFFVRKEYRRKGIAKYIFEQFEDLAKEKGAKRIDLMVWEFNESALELYEALGMKKQRRILEKKL